MKKGLLYIHGKDGHAEEAEFFRPLFPERDVVGFDYRSTKPWEALEEFIRYYDGFRAAHDSVVIVANSLGAYFTLTALGEKDIEKACFISPVVNMKKLIDDMMSRAGVTEKELFERGNIDTPVGEPLSWEYLTWVKSHPVAWNTPTAILYGEKDRVQSIETIRGFADTYGASVTVMKNAEHWFHTEEQLAFLTDWIRREMP